MKRILIMALCVIVIMAMIPVQTLAYSDKVIRNDEKLTTNTAYQDVTVKEGATFNLNGFTLEMRGNLNVEDGAVIKNGGLLFKKKGTKLSGVKLYANAQGRFYEIDGGLDEIWKKWEGGNDYMPHLFYDYACKGYCFPSVANGGAGYDVIDNGFKNEHHPDYQTEQEEIAQKKAVTLTSSVIKGVKNTKITVKTVAKPGNTDQVYAGVRWVKSGNYKIDGYKLYRSTSKDCNYKCIATFSSKEIKGYRDTNVKSGKTYYYKVRGFRFGHDNTKESGMIYTAYSSPVKVIAK